MNDILAPDPITIESYRRALATHGPTPAALGWSKPEQIDIRHAALCGPMSAEVGTTVLDYGCGLGHLIAQGFPPADYTGADPVPELITAARALHPDHRFIDLKDPKADLGSLEWDHIVCCGTFTDMGGRDEGAHRKYVREMMRVLLLHCRVGLHVDFLAADVSDRQHAGNLYADPWDVIAMARGLSRRVAIDASYLPYEFCVHIFKDQDITERNTYRGDV